MPTKNATGLYKIPLDPGGKPEPGKVSEMFLEFAQPLLEIDPGGPPNVQALNSIMMLAVTCWNLPVMEAQKDAQSSATRKMFDAAMLQMPSIIRDVLLQLVNDRTGKFGAVPFFLTVRVEGKSVKSARIIAEARLPKASMPMN